MDTEELYDSLYKEVEEFVKPLDFIRPGQLQIRFLLGYMRANRIINDLIAKGIIVNSEVRNYKVIKHGNNDTGN